MKRRSLRRDEDQVTLYVRWLDKHIVFPIVYILYISIAENTISSRLKRKNRDHNQDS